MGYAATTLEMNERSALAIQRERADAILWVRVQMAKYGVSLNDLENAGCFQKPTKNREPAPPQLPRYRNAMGQTWDGTGSLPDWLQRAVDAGQSIDFFQIDAR